MSQFAFVNAGWPEVWSHAVRAETSARSDPRGACFYARLALETAVKWMYRADRSLRSPYDTNLAALLAEPSFKALAGEAVSAKARLTRDLGNKAVHEARTPPDTSAITGVRELFHVCYWLARTYGRGAEAPLKDLAFDPAKLPLTTTVSAASLKALQALAADRDAAERARLADEQARVALDAELAQLRAEVAAAKAANAARPDTHDCDEAETRDAFIDFLLNEAGWRLDQAHDREFEVEGQPTRTGKGHIDYVLWGDDGAPLGLVEAKRARRDPQEGQHQAKLYADALEARFSHRPVIFYTNGYEHWLWDDQRYPPRRVSGFLTRDELALMLQRRASIRALAEVEVSEAIVERYYQYRAIRRIAETFEADKARKALLVMATGSGKTRTVIALADLLIRANWVKRVLFLADRKALVRQAVNAFKAHLPSVTTVNLLDDKFGEGRVFVSTYPTMMGLINERSEGARRFGPGFFDLIVVDEAHRSIYRKYGALFDWFDGLLVELTATPKAEIDRDTYRMFALGSGPINRLSPLGVG